ncbi:MAG TPA: histidine kinase dimerization/phospho-acceptor domain-containing protein, partial [Candidatus Saccharibacteria bacterium]|nr:histidine kinase dimerization/phospho-acceptor domain-containing protein [Candidatus Saccharibacteria bacterium]
MLTPIAIILLILGIFNIVFGVSVFAGNRRNKQALIFMVFSIAVALWCIGIGLFYLSPSPEIAIWFVKLYYFAAALIAYSLLLFVIQYVGQTISKKVFTLLLIPFIAILFAVFHSGGVVTEVVVYPNPIAVLNTPVYLLYAAYFTIYFIAAMIVVGRGYFLSDSAGSRDKAGAFYILIAMAISGVFGMLFNLFLPLIGNYSLIWIGPLGSIWMVVLISIAVMRHSLFDIRVTTAKILAFLLTFTLFFSVYYCVGYVITATAFFGSLDPNWRELLQLTILSVLAIWAHALPGYLENIINKRLFRYDYSEVELAKHISRLVTSATGLQQLLDSATYEIARKLGAESAVMIAKLEDSVASSSYGQVSGVDAFMMDIVAKMPAEASPTLVEYMPNPSTRQIFNRLDIVLYAPFIYNDTLIGFLGLGKRSQGGYNERDVQALTTVGAELAIAMQNALYVQKIQNFNESLKNEVDRATAELRASNQKLKQIDQAKDEFVSLTSHQLRTPLTTIKGYISMLLDGDAGELKPQQRKLLDEAFNSSSRMSHLISDFLNISRIQTGKFEIELTEVNLAETLGEEIEQLRISATSRQLTLDYNKPENFPVLQADEGKIRQVMMNFIDNAIYYSPAGSTIRVLLSSNANGIEFKVID